MVNPFNSGDKVSAMRKGVEITATVRTTWNHEVQIRSDTGELLWRTMKTIRLLPAGEPESVAGNPSEVQETTDASHCPHEQSPAQTVSAEVGSGAPIDAPETRQQGIPAEGGAISNRETPEEAPEEPAPTRPRSREGKRATQGGTTRKKRSRK